MRRGIALAAALLAGCSGIAERARVSAPLPPQAGAGAPLGPVAPKGAPAQDFAIGPATPPEWWKSFASPALDALVGQALAANQDLVVADATLRQAREAAAIAGGALGPQVDASYQAQRAKVGNLIATPLADPNATLYTLHTAQLTVAYPVDVFGGLRAKARSARAAAEVARLRLLAARQTVAANLTLAVINRAALSDQIEATRAAIAASAGTLELTRQRQRLGAAGAADVAQQEAALATLEGTLPALERGEVHQRAVIALLLARPPGSELPPLPRLDELALPEHLPVSEPAEVVAHRADVQAAAAQVREAAADAGAALAARFPAFALTANGGGTAGDFGRMFADGNLFWSVLGSVTAPVFHMGALRHQQRSAEAALDASKAQYRSAVLQAFSDISDALTGLHGDGEALAAAMRGDAAGQRSLAFARRQLEIGDIGTLGLLTAQSAAQQARLALIQARAARLADTVALYQANGTLPPAP